MTDHQSPSAALRGLEYPIPNIFFRQSAAGAGGRGGLLGTGGRAETKNGCLAPCLQVAALALLCYNSANLADCMCSLPGQPPWSVSALCGGVLSLRAIIHAGVAFVKLELCRAGQLHLFG